jgi:hypothetical protein
MQLDASMDVRGLSVSGFRYPASDFQGFRKVPPLSEGESRIRLARPFYTLVMVKVPEPVQPVLPVRFHVPVIVFPLTAPDRVKVLPVGVDDCTVMPNLPFTLPLKFPPKMNDPLSVSAAKHGELGQITT